MCRVKLLSFEQCVCRNYGTSPLARHHFLEKLSEQSVGVDYINMDRIELVKQAAEQWAKDLTDESGRNRLLYYKELRTGTLNLDRAEPRVRRRLLKGSKVKLSKLFPHDQTDDASADQFRDALRRLRAVNRQATVNFEERGIRTLFLGWGMATWMPVSSSATPNAPVLLCPVEVGRTGVGEVDFDLWLGGDWTLNEALLQHLSNTFDVDASVETLMDPYGDGEQISEDEEQAIFAELRRRAEFVPEFNTSEHVVLGNFMFKKMPMVNDIRNNLEALSSHDLIAAIAGDDSATESLRSHRTGAVDLSLPDRTTPQEEFLVLDADSSQNAAINAALAGESFVLQGPPGTGKSQTISNLIASMMAQGSSVLFVAEKRAAIEAVVKRLKQVGLDEFVMDLHGGVASRRDLAQKLDKSLRTIGQTQQVVDDGLQRRLEDCRAELCGYAEALHQVREPWGLSYFEVLSRLAALETDSACEAARPPPAMWLSASTLALLDETRIGQVLRDLGDWVDLSEPTRLGRSPWAGARIDSDDEAREALDACIDLSSEATFAFSDQYARLCGELDIDSSGTVAEGIELVATLTALTVDLERTESSLSLEAFDLDLDRLARDLEPATGSVFKRIFNKRYRAAKAELDRLRSAAAKLKPRELRETVLAALDLNHRWTELGAAGLPRFPVHLAGSASARDALIDAVDLLCRFSVDGLTDCTTEDLAARAGALVNDQATLFRLAELSEVETRLRELHIGSLLDKVLSKTLLASDLKVTFEYCWLRSIQQGVLLEDRRLSAFQGTRQSRYVEEFIKADKQHLRAAPARISRRVAECAVKNLNQLSDQEKLIRQEASKKRRHLPLRKLFGRAPGALTALRPCWAMSPLDVAQTLPPESLFDLVIFDEASQVMPCDAVCALLRGKRAMVAGDSRQLPPTSFFESSSVEDDYEDEADSLADYESILDVMDSRVHRRPLTWHYRSQDERLIAYSNQQIYHGSLTTFPGADSDRCLDWVLVPHRMGVTTEKGSNSDEVLKVVDLMIDHARIRPLESLGVIAMGMNHANRIDESLRRRIQEENSQELEDFFGDSKEERAFVKNLERVQGDERDAIILSVGYGKHASGEMLYRFGPLNMEGGERRLNVAITRARKRMTLVSSFEYADMDPKRTRAKGTAMLRGFLKFAESGGAELDGADAQMPLNSFEVDVLNKLSASGLDIVPQYGCSGYRIDFAVRHRSKAGFALAVEADGASYHSSPTARDRDRLRQEHLERLGWRFCRIWSTDWFNDHRREVERVLAAFEASMASIDAATSHPTHFEPQTTNQPELESAGIKAAQFGIPPPPKSPRPNIPVYKSIEDYSHKQIVSICRWVLSDGLLHTDSQLFDEVLKELPFTRRGTRIDRAINRAIASVRSSDR